MAALATAVQSYPAGRLAGAQAACRQSLERRFGWLTGRLLAVRGNLSELKPHEQILWRARQRLVSRYNAAGAERDAAKRERAYLKIAKDCER